MLNHRAIALQGVGAGLGARAVAVQGFAGVEADEDAQGLPTFRSAGPVARRRINRRKRRRDEEQFLLLGLAK